MGLILIKPNSDTKSCLHIYTLVYSPISLRAKNVSMKISHDIISYQIIMLVLKRLFREGSIRDQMRYCVIARIVDFIISFLIAHWFIISFVDI